MVTSAVFSGKKEGYLESLSQPFLDTRLSEFSKALEASATSSCLCKFLLDQTDSFSKRNSLLAEAALPPPCRGSDMKAIMDLQDCSQTGDTGIPLGQKTINLSRIPWGVRWTRV